MIKLPLLKARALADQHDLKAWVTPPSLTTGGDGSVVATLHINYVPASADDKVDAKWTFISPRRDQKCTATRCRLR
ncbi:MAG: hypothetical protein U1F42_04910 [Candidatus Competibacteraceae bacterium]